MPKLLRLISKIPFDLMRFVSLAGLYLSLTNTYAATFEEIRVVEKRNGFFSIKGDRDVSSMEYIPEEGCPQLGSFVFKQADKVIGVAKIERPSPTRFFIEFRYRGKGRKSRVIYSLLFNQGRLGLQRTDPFNSYQVARGDQLIVDGRLTFRLRDRFVKDLVKGEITNLFLLPSTDPLEPPFDGGLWRISVDLKQLKRGDAKVLMAFAGLFSKTASFATIQNPAQVIVPKPTRQASRSDLPNASISSIFDSSVLLTLGALAGKFSPGWRSHHGGQAEPPVSGSLSPEQAPRPEDHSQSAASPGKSVGSSYVVVTSPAAPPAAPVGSRIMVQQDDGSISPLTLARSPLGRRFADSEDSMGDSESAAEADLQTRIKRVSHDSESERPAAQTAPAPEDPQRLGNKDVADGIEASNLPRNIKIYQLSDLPFKSASYWAGSPRTHFDLRGFSVPSHRYLNRINMIFKGTTAVKALALDDVFLNALTADLLAAVERTGKKITDLLREPSLLDLAYVTEPGWIIKNMAEKLVVAKPHLQLVLKLSHFTRPDGQVSDPVIDNIKKSPVNIVYVKIPKQLGVRTEMWILTEVHRKLTVEGRQIEMGVFSE